jgi:hypothetical protein
VIWLGSEIGLEQVAGDLKWPSGNGENERTYEMDEFCGDALLWIEDMSLIQVSKNWIC